MKTHSKLFSLATVVLALLSANLCLAQNRQGPPPFVISPDHTNGIYAVGETAHWRIQRTGTNAMPQPAHYKLLKGELTKAAEGDLAFADGVATLDSKFEAPGHVLLEVKIGGDQSSRSLGGAVASIDQIKTSSPRPDDFDAFWDAKLKELAAVPANPQLESAESNMRGVSYWKITMNNIRGSHIYGQIARPTADGKYPAALVFQWAGVYALQQQWVTGRAASGWLTMNIEPHDMPIDASDTSKAPDNYPSIGLGDREQCYFLRMYLACYRAVDYLRSRPDWNGKVLVTVGASQGGMQSLMVAGLNPGVTTAMALVPAGSDLLGQDVGREDGWPHLYYQTGGGKNAKQVHEACRYFDVGNFAPHIACPVLVGCGLIDDTCPPEGILATYNLIKSPKQLVVLAKSGHQDINGSQKPYAQVESFWWDALRQGKPAPVSGK